MSNKHKNKGRVMDQTTTANVANAPHSAEEAVQATQESLDQVRDILFGTQLRDQDRRFASLEEKLAADFAAFREENRQRLTQLETFLKTELAALAAQVTLETRQRQDAATALKTDLTTTAQGLEKQLGDAHTQHAAAEADLRQQLLDLTTSARAELKSTQTELTTLLEKLTNDLRHTKTDRTALAGLFTELAGRLQ
jgi:hypothetical protein